MYCLHVSGGRAFEVVGGHHRMREATALVGCKMRASGRGDGDKKEYGNSA
jgi:hypothetical protein